jgi:hypothetical protein
LGNAGGQLGPHATIALAVQLNKQFRVLFGMIATLFRDRFGPHVTATAVVRALFARAAHLHQAVKDEVVHSCGSRISDGTVSILTIADGPSPRRA